jgi:hypothetical protein
MEHRKSFQLIWERRLEDLDRWLRETGDGYEVTKLTKDGTEITLKVGKDPGKAASILAGMAEHFVPKLQRNEVVGEGGGPLEVVIRDLAKP